MIILDRFKDVIKSVGEWISTVELEDFAISHDAVANAAAIAAKHAKWDEHPVIIAIKRDGAELDEAALLAHYTGKVASWQIPDTVIFVNELPLSGTGRVLKNQLRDWFGDVLLDAS